jgi:ferredoxin-NADP reductase
MEYKLKIMAVEQDAVDIRRFILVKPRDLRFIPGRRLMIAINKPGLENDKRAFACTSLNSDYYLEFIVRELKYDRFSENLRKVKAGEELIVFSESIGTTEYKGRGAFFACGNGILPFVAIFRQLRQEGALTGNSLFYIAKIKDELLLERELKHLFERNANILLTREQRTGYESRKFDETLVKEKALDLNQEFYIAGPEDFVSEVRQILTNLGVTKINAEVVD